MVDGISSIMCFDGRGSFNTRGRGMRERQTVKDGRVNFLLRWGEKVGVLPRRLG